MNERQSTPVEASGSTLSSSDGPTRHPPLWVVTPGRLQNKAGTSFLPLRSFAVLTGVASRGGISLDVFSLTVALLRAADKVACFSTSRGLIPFRQGTSHSVRDRPYTWGNDCFWLEPGSYDLELTTRMHWRILFYGYLRSEKTGAGAGLAASSFQS